MIKITGGITMKKQLGKLIFGACMAIFAVTLIACGGNDNDTDQGAAHTDGGTPATSEPIEIVMWGSWSGGQIDQLEALIEIYNNSQDEFRVVYVVQQMLEEQLLTGIAGGELPDLILWDRVQTAPYAARGALKSLDALIERDGVDMDSFFSEAVREMNVDGEQFGIPLLVDTRIIFYNRDLMGDFEVPRTWDDVLEVAPQLTVRDGHTLVQSGFSLQDVGLFNMYMLQAGGELMDEADLSVNFDSPAGHSVLEFWDALLNDERVFDLGFDADGNQFAAGNLAMFYNGPWAIADLGNVEDLNFGVSLPLVGPNGDTGSIMGGFGLVMPQGSPNYEGAWDFMRWWTTQPENGVEFGRISGWIPANIEAANDPFFTDDDIYAVFVEAMNNARIRPTVEGYANFEGLVLIPQLQNWISGTIDAQEALSTVDEQGTQLLRENN